MAEAFTDASNINAAKDRLAYEVTKMIHGEDEAAKAQTAAKSVFYGGADDENMPTTTLTEGDFGGDSISIVDLLVITKLAKSKSDARTLVSQGGIWANDEKVSDFGYAISKKDLQNGAIIKKGKKVFHKVMI
jgi:tyrosyl-tRNA synthetase